MPSTMKDPPMDELDAIRTLEAGKLATNRAAEEHAWARVSASLSRHPAPDLKQPSTRRRRRLTLAIAASLALVILVVGVLLPARWGGPDPASATLSDLAETSAAQTDPVIPAGSFLYSSRTSLELMDHTDLVSPSASWAFLVRSSLETWIAHDGSGVRITTYSHPRFLDGADRAAWVAAGSLPLVPNSPVRETFAPGTFDTVDLSGLSTDVETLRDQLESLVPAPPDDLAIFDLIGEYLSDQIVPVELRSSLFGVAASLDALEDLGPTADPLGRPGVGIRMSEGDRSTTLIFDETSSRLLASVAQSDIDGQTVVTWRTFGMSELTDVPPPAKTG
jgi:hypothetical protein